MLIYYFIHKVAVCLCISTPGGVGEGDPTHAGCVHRPTWSLQIKAWLVYHRYIERKREFSGGSREGVSEHVPTPRPHPHSTTPQTYFKTGFSPKNRISPKFEVWGLHYTVWNHALIPIISVHASPPSQRSRSATGKHNTCISYGKDFNNHCTVR